MSIEAPTQSAPGPAAAPDAEFPPSAEQYRR